MTSESEVPWRRAWRWAACGAAVLALRWIVTVLTGTPSDDETWFLQVARRVASGETLHRDVFFGSTPLAVWIAATAARVAGAEILVLRAVFAAIATASALAGVRLARLCGVRVPLWAVVLAGPFVPPPSADQIYGTLAIGLLLVAAGETLVATRLAVQAAGDRRVRTAVLAAGLAAGFAFASKPNVGALAIAAVTVGVGVRCGLVAAVRSAAAATFAALLPMVPIVLRGAAPECLEQVLLGKGSYFAVAGMSPVESFGLALAPIRGGGVSTAFDALASALAMVLPAAAAVALVVAVARERGAVRARLVCVAAFVLAGFVFVFPRADVVHFRHVAIVAVSGLLVAAGSLGALASPAMRRTAAAVTIVCFGAALVRGVYPPLRDVQRGVLVVSDLPSFRAQPLPRTFVDEVEAARPALVAVTRESPTLILCPSAALWYLVTESQNPTRYDYPFVTTFGRRGEDATIAALRDGRIRVVCVAAHWWAPELVPTRLLGCVRDTFRQDGAIGNLLVCRAQR